MRHSLCPASIDPRFVGDPVDTLTGAVTEQTLDFRLIGPLEFWWVRHYNSAENHRRCALGWGHAHDFDRVIRFDVDGIIYHGPVGRVVGFSPLLSDGDECRREGFMLRRVSQLRYELHHHGEPATEFEFRTPSEPARPKRIFQGGHQVLFGYNNARRWERIVDSAGRNIRVVEDEGGRIISLTLDSESGQPGSLLVGYQYDERGNLIATTNAAGHSFRFAYDAANRMVLRTGRMGLNFRFEYDSKGRCTRSAGDSGIEEVSLEYAIPGRVTKVTHADGGVWQYFFNESGGLTQIVDPLGGVQQFVRDDSGRVTLELDPNGNATRVAYDRTGAAVAKISPFGHVATVPEDPNAPDPQAHRVAGNAAEYELGRLLDTGKIIVPTPREAAGLPVPFEARTFIATRPEEAALTALRKGFEAKPLGPNWWPKPKQGRIFNDLGKLVRQEDQWGRTREWNYNASGNLEQHTDFDGQKWLYDYGMWHLRLGATNPMGANVRFTYYTSGVLASCIDAGGTRSEYGYDLKDQLVEVRRHGTVRDKYTRDTVGNLTAKHAGDGRPLLQFEIGPGNRPTKRILASGDEHTFEYDKSGRYLTAATEKDSVKFAYDSLGNCRVEKRNDQGVEHRFRGWRQPTESVYFDHFVVRHQRQPDGALVIIDPGGKQHHIRLLSHGLVERQFSNGSREFAQYDGQGRCHFKCAQRVVGQPWSRAYHWSGEGELRRVRDSMLGEIRHEYDSAHRLRRRILPNGRTEEYEHDRADNLVRQPGLEEVVMEQGNRIRTVNGWGVEYNDRNHIALRQTPAGTVRYGYDSRDQLVRVERPQGLWEAEYDALGRRTRKICEGEATEYYWNTDQLVAEQHPDGRLRLYIYSDPLALTPLLFLDYDSVDAAPESCRRYFVFSDQIGTPCLVEHESGSEVWRARIDPLGNAQVASGAKIEFNLRFPGHYFDPELGLHYNRFRCYDPRLGRYLQSDPWGISGGYNLYSYRTNPLLEVDVRGLGAENSDDEKPPGQGGPEEEANRPAGQEDEDARPPLMSKEDAEALARQTNAEYRAELDAKIARGEMSQRDAGPVAATVVDRATGEAFSAHNDRHGNPPDDMHPLIASQVAESQASPQHPSDPGSHAEVHALNDAVNAREAARREQGLPPMTKSDLDEFTQVSEWRRGSGDGRMTPGDDAPRCGNCQTATDGVDNRSGDAPLRPPSSE